MTYASPLRAPASQNARCILVRSLHYTEFIIRRNLRDQKRKEKVNEQYQNAVSSFYSPRKTEPGSSHLLQDELASLVLSILCSHCFALSSPCQPPSP